MPVKISALPSLGTMTDAAIIPVVASSTTSQITGANLKTYFSSVTGNITGGNINTGGVVSATGSVTGSQFNGSGAGLSSIPGANVSGAVANATYATNSGTVTTAAQGNITSVGTLTSLGVTGNITGGNINVAGMSLSGNVVSAINTTANVTTTANISGSYVLGNGSQLTGVSGPAFVATQTSYQNLASSPSSLSLLSLIYNNVIANTDSGYNSATGVFTASKAGYYQVSGSIGVNILGNISADGAGALVMYYNGNTYAAGPFIQAQQAITGNVLTTVVSQSSLSTLVYLNNSDTVQLKLGYITNAASNVWTTETNLVPSSFQAAWIRP